MKFSKCKRVFAFFLALAIVLTTYVGTAVPVSAYTQVDLEELDALIAEKETLPAYKYTMLSWNAYAAAVKKAVEMRADLSEVTGQEVKDAAAAIKAAKAALVKITDLRGIIEEAKAMDQEPYSAASYAKLMELVESAEAALENPETTAAEIDELCSELIRFEEKDLINITNLKGYIRTLETMDLSIYTAKSVEKMKAELAVCEAQADTLLTKAEYNELFDKVVAAQMQLVDCMELNQRIEQYEALDSERYTKSSWDALLAKIAEIRLKLATEDLTKSDVNALRDELYLTRDSLVDRGNAQALRELAADLRALDPANYSAASYNKLMELVERVEAQADDPNLTQAQTNELVLELIEMRNQDLVDITELKASLAAYETLDYSLYTPKSVERFKARLAEIKAEMDLLENRDAARLLETEIDNMIDMLVDVGSLISFFEIAEDWSANKHLYTPNSWDPFETAINVAKERLATEDLTADDVEALYNEIYAAFYALTPRAADVYLNELERIIARIEADYKEEDYTAASWSALETALAEAKLALTDPNTTREICIAVYDNLQNAEYALVSVAELNMLIKLVEETDSSGYTKASWDLLMAEVDAVKEAIRTQPLTNEEVSALRTDLSNALWDIPVSKTSLQSAIDGYRAMNFEDFTPKSVEKYKAFLDSIEDAMEDCTTEDELSAYHSEVDNAFWAILVECSGLNWTIEEAEALTPDGYTADSWNTLQEKLNEAKEKLANEDMTANDVLAADLALESAIINLEERANEDQFTDILDELAQLTPEDYTEASWEYLEELVEQIDELLADENATEADADYLLQEITDAVENLVDISELKEMLEEAELAEELGLDEEFTAESWEALLEKAEEARELLENPDVTQDEVDSMIDELYDASDALVESGDSEALAEAVEDAKENGNLDDYTDESAEAIEKALEKAEELIANRAPQDEIDAALAELEEALANAEEKPADTPAGDVPDTGDYTSFAIPAAFLAAACILFVLRRRFAR